MEREVGKAVQTPLAEQSLPARPSIIQNWFMVSGYYHRQTAASQPTLALFGILPLFLPRLNDG